MPAGSTDFGQGNGSVYASYFSGPRVALEFPPAQVSTTQSTFVAFVARVDRALLGSAYHAATYATVFGNTATPNAQNTIVCRYYGPNESDVGLRNRFAFYVTDSANTNTFGMTPSPGGSGNITLNILSEPITTDGPVAVILQIHRVLNSSGVPTLIRAYVLTAHSDTNGNTVTQQSAAVDLPVFAGINTSCPFWGIGSANTSGTLTNGNYWPGVLSQFLVGWGSQLFVADVEDYFDGRWFPTQPNLSTNVVAGRFARRLGYLNGGVGADVRTFADVTDSMFPAIDTYPGLVWNGSAAWREGGTLTGYPIDTSFVKVVRWATRPKQDTVAQADSLPRTLWVKCAAALPGVTLDLNGRVVKADFAANEQYASAGLVTFFNVDTGVGGTTNNQVLSRSIQPFVAAEHRQASLDFEINGVSGGPPCLLLSRQYSRLNSGSFTRKVVIADSHTASALLTAGTPTLDDAVTTFTLSVRDAGGSYLRLHNPWRFGYNQYVGRTGELIVVPALSSDTAAVVSTNLVTTVRSEVLAASPHITAWVHAHHRYAGGENAGTIAATATTYMNALYNNANFASINVAVLDPGHFGPQSESGLGSARPALFYENLRTAYRTWVSSSTFRRFVQHFEYDGDWDSGNSPYMRVRNAANNLLRYVRRLYLNIATQDRGQTNSLLVEYFPARFTSPAKNEFVVRLAPPLSLPTAYPSFVMHTPGARPSLEISEDGGATWLRPETPAAIGTTAYFSTALRPDGSILVAKQASVPGASWLALTPGQLRVRYGYGFPSLNVEVPAGLSGSAAYQHIMSAAGAVYQQSPLATPFGETGISVEPFDVVVGEPPVLALPGMRSLASTGAGR